MITYELAKQLKDAGFPQKNGKSHEAYYLNGGENTGLVDYDMYNDVDDDFRDWKFVYIPTLSELIEACGDRFGSLQRNIDGWYCFNYARDIKSFFGSTPEEAVARLWLELNKK